MKHKKGSALLLTLFLLSGIMVVAFAGSYLVVAGLRSGALQYDSARAYFAAESGAEYILYQVRGGYYYPSPQEAAFSDNIFSKQMPDGYAASFIVGYKQFAPIVLTSIGSYGVTKRSIELNF